MEGYNGSLLESHCDPGLVPMKVHLLLDLCDDLEKFYSIQFLDAVPYENLYVYFKRAYSRTSMRRAIRKGETGSAMKTNVY